MLSENRLTSGWISCSSLYVVLLFIPLTTLMTLQTKHGSRCSFSPLATYKEGLFSLYFSVRLDLRIAPSLNAVTPDISLLRAQLSVRMEASAFLSAPRLSGVHLEPNFYRRLHGNYIYIFWFFI